ncbi:MAG: hypothetical protein D6688_01465 [Alphaproteobacteria bacterium]|nr:MAG: hypothetical protein D6688_01465 [Alphaproteobacteria bacterium]
MDRYHEVFMERIGRIVARHALYQRGQYDVVVRDDGLVTRVPRPSGVLGFWTFLRKRLTRRSLGFAAAEVGPEDASTLLIRRRRRRRTLRVGIPWRGLLGAVATVIFFKALILAFLGDDLYALRLEEMRQGGLVRSVSARVLAPDRPTEWLAVVMREHILAHFRA